MQTPPPPPGSTPPPPPPGSTPPPPPGSMANPIYQPEKDMGPADVVSKASKVKPRLQAPPKQLGAPKPMKEHKMLESTAKQLDTFAKMLDEPHTPDVAGLDALSESKLVKKSRVKPVLTESKKTSDIQEPNEILTLWKKIK